MVFHYLLSSTFIEHYQVGMLVCQSLLSIIFYLRPADGCLCKRKWALNLTNLPNKCQDQLDLLPAKLEPSLVVAIHRSSIQFVVTRTLRPKRDATILLATTKQVSFLQRKPSVWSWLLAITTPQSFSVFKR